MYFVPIIIVLFVVLLLGIIIIDRKRCKQFSNGTWIDRDGNLLILKISNNKILVSFGVNVENDEYELSEKEYKYSLSRVPLSTSYKLKIDNIRVTINYVSGIATVYDGKKKIGKFAKNNLIAFN
jgi:mRNA-degrading endonuclease RelE of RelBE toxin-antitoxin system